MPKSMTGFGRCCLDEAGMVQTWEIRSVNNRFLDIKWRLPSLARGMEDFLEKVLRKHAQRGRLDITLSLSVSRADLCAVNFNAPQALAMLEKMAEFAEEQSLVFEPDLNRFLSLPFLWEDNNMDNYDELAHVFEQGFELALDDWNESREREGKILERDLTERILRMREWAEHIKEQAPSLKEERFNTLRERIDETLSRYSLELEESRFLQEITILADKMDVSEELTRLAAHLDLLSELMAQGADVGRRLDFAVQECFREITTCGNKVQDAQVQRLVVDFKNELEKCREQVQNLE